MDAKTPVRDTADKAAESNAQDRPVRTPPVMVRKPDFGTRPTVPRPAAGPAIGAVLRREPVSSGPSRSAHPATWRVAPLPPSSVDNSEGRGRRADAGHHGPDGSVDNRAEPPRARIGEDGVEDDDIISILPSVDNRELFDEDLPRAQYIEPAVPTRLKGPQAYRPQGRSGPDREIVRLLREANKQRLVDRARASGRDPNEGAQEVVKGYTRSAKTQQQYIDRGNQLLARYRRERGIVRDDLLFIDTVEFADWVISLKPTLKPTTWRPYKQSAKAVLETLPDSDAAISLLDADTVEPGSEPERKASKAKDKDGRAALRRTSARKAKSISKADFDRIVNYLRFLSSSKYAPTLADWLVAGVATGLRPGEWMATTIEIVEDQAAPGGRYVWLYVLNAKHTNNRGNGAARTVDLSGLRDETVDAVRRMSDRGREWLLRGTYADMQGQCAQLMYHTGERLFPGRKLSYSLYTTRHQFIANAKSYHRPEAVSAMAGHVVTDTAVENYGKKRSAWAPEDIVDRAAPVSEEVATVKRRHTFFEDRQKMREAAGLKPLSPSPSGEA